MTVDDGLYPLARYVPAHSSNYARGPVGRAVDHVVLHVTDGHGDPFATAEMWQTVGHKSSAHFVIGQSGTVIQCVHLDDIAWHAHYANGRSIGIEHCARTPGERGFPAGDPGLPVSDAQYAVSARLVRWLCARYVLPIDRVHVLGHNEADPATTHTRCPTGALDWDKWWAATEASASNTP